MQQLIAAYADLSVPVLAETLLGPLPPPPARAPKAEPLEFAWTPWLSYTVQYMPEPAATLLRTQCEWAGMAHPPTASPVPSPLQRCAIVALKLAIMDQKCPGRVQTLVAVRHEKEQDPELVSPHYPFDRSVMHTTEQYLDWIRFVADVRAMHEHGCEHGDLDSSNVMWDSARQRWVMIDVETSGPFSALDVHVAAGVVRAQFPVLAPALKDPLVLELAQCRNSRSHAPVPLFMDDLVDLVSHSIGHGPSCLRVGDSILTDDDSILTDDQGQYFVRSRARFAALLKEVAALPFPKDHDWLYELGEYLREALADFQEMVRHVPPFWVL
jgi:hypothetical protein